MNYCDTMRKKIGNNPLIIVRPSIAILNHNGEILLNRYIGGIWSIPGDILQLNESVEECLERNVFNDIGLTIKQLTLFGVYSGMELINRVEESGDEYQTVAIGYLCTEYDGQIMPDQNQGIEAQFFSLNDLPKDMDPFIRNKLVELNNQLKN
ncbi:NUDIX domain-containing protein [Gottfriedia acidiceleris]|uniref:NUDIX domain-containing protein n=1 Tax=Gottfriedia acidiceleris TaxID=371036 RepID=UPI003D1D2EEE